jgi:hypothetical protein
MTREQIMEFVQRVPRPPIAEWPPEVLEWLARRISSRGHKDISAQEQRGVRRREPPRA